MSVQYEALKKFCHIGAHAQCVHVIVCMHTVAVQRPTVVYSTYCTVCVEQEYSISVYCRN